MHTHTGGGGQTHFSSLKLVGAQCVWDAGSVAMSIVQSNT